MFHYFLQLNFATIFVDFRQCKSCISEKGHSVVFYCDKLSTVSGYR